MRWTLIVVFSVFAAASVGWSEDLVVSGQSVVIDSDRRIDGSILATEAA